MTLDNIPLSKNLVKYLSSLKSKKVRSDEKKFIIEGVRICREALDCNVNILNAILVEEKCESQWMLPLVNDIKRLGIPTSLATEKQFKAFTSTDNPQGIAFVVEKGFLNLTDFWRKSFPLVLGVDEIRDPGNLGTILRTADWFGIQSVLMNTGTVEVHNPKVVRSTMGSIFRLNLVENISWEKLLPEMKGHGYRVIALESQGGISLGQIKKSGKDLILVGGEATGFAPFLKKFYDVKVTIPKLGHGESLNAAMAAGIFLSHFTLNVTKSDD